MQVSLHQGKVRVHARCMCAWAPHTHAGTQRTFLIGLERMRAPSMGFLKLFHLHYFDQSLLCDLSLFPLPHQELAWTTLYIPR